MASIKMACVAVMALILSAAIAEGAITCGNVVMSMAPCLGYLTQGEAVSAPCCNGAKGLKAACRTKPDLRQACKCLVSLATSVPGLDFDAAAALPGKCRITLPVKFSRSINCDRL